MAEQQEQPTHREQRQSPLGPLLKRGNLDDGWRLALWLLVTLRVALGTAGVLSLLLEPVRSVGGDWLNLVLHGGEPWSQWLSSWQRWDALWYQQIAEHGYHAGDNTVAFYPLYPLLARVVSLAFGGRVIGGELAVSSAAFACAIWLLYQLAKDDGDAMSARLTVLLIVCFPVGFFLLAPYTESLYLALTVAAFWFSRRGQPWLAGMAAFAAGLTRAQGAFLVLPLAFDVLHQHRQDTKRCGFDLVAAILPVLGVLAVAGYDRLIVHESQSGLSVLTAWGYRVVPPWTAIQASWLHIRAHVDAIELLNLICLLGFGLLTLLMVRRLSLAYVLYLAPYLALLATRQMYFSPLASVSRYTLVLFPCFILVATWLVKHPALAAGWLVISLFLQVSLWEYWVHFGFVA